MSDGVLLIGTFGAAYVGFALLALSQTRHWRRVLDAPPPSFRQPRMLRALGGAAIGLSLALALLRDGPGFGALLWATVLSLVALAVAFTLAWRPKWLQPLALLGTGLAMRFLQRDRK